MSELRNHLEKLRDEYRSTGYPGSLAADIVRRPAPARRSTFGRIAAAASVVIALAAAVALWVSLDSTVTPVAAPPAGDVIVAAVAVDELGAMPALPDDLPLVPEAQSISELDTSMSDIGAMPEMPSMDLNFSYDTETTEDSV
jgi:hypothetical protein